MLCAEVVLIDSMSPAPRMVAKRIMIALSWISAGANAPQQDEQIESNLACRRCCAVSFSAVSISATFRLLLSSNLVQNATNKSVPIVEEMAPCAFPCLRDVLQKKSYKAF